mmetsp:Transcript_6661/g.13347  ORF Transcript_6661/g.13347 Transcript_6661/m.13347 type:complete len:224 (+) Transcript_6661:1012-1683(+)
MILLLMVLNILFLLKCMNPLQILNQIGIGIDMLLIPMLLPHDRIGLNAVSTTIVTSTAVSTFRICVFERTIIILSTACLLIHTPNIIPILLLFQKLLLIDHPLLPRDRTRTRHHHRLHYLVGRMTSLLLSRPPQQSMEGVDVPSEIGVEETGFAGVGSGPVEYGGPLAGGEGGGGVIGRTGYEAVEFGGAGDSIVAVIVVVISYGAVVVDGVGKSIRGDGSNA